MAKPKLRYVIGDKVLVSRDETGENHEPGVVFDSYELIMGDERRPIVVVEFEDGERQYIAATTPNVLPVEPEEDEDEGQDEDELEEIPGTEASGGDAATAGEDEAA